MSLDVSLYWRGGGVIAVNLFILIFFFFVVNVGEDCPVFEGLFEFCSISAGGSIGKYGVNVIPPPLETGILLFLF